MFCDFLLTFMAPVMYTVQYIRQSSWSAVNKRHCVGAAVVSLQSVVIQRVSGDIHIRSIRGRYVAAVFPRVDGTRSVSLSHWRPDGDVDLQQPARQWASLSSEPGAALARGIERYHVVILRFPATGSQTAAAAATSPQLPYLHCVSEKKQCKNYLISVKTSSNFRRLWYFSRQMTNTGNGK